jgi:hypothetical protein
MVKAEIKNTDGTHITIEGSEEEVKRLISLLKSPDIIKDKRKSQEEKAPSSKMSISDMLLELKEEKFFDNPKSLVEIKNALEEKGRIYEITTLSAQVIRQVRKRNLGRIKKDKKWMYVKR